MYDFGRRVYCKPVGAAGTVAERGWLGRGARRRAQYVVVFDRGRDPSLPPDFACGAGDLRPADYQCDGCGEWRAGPPYGGPRDEDGGLLAAYCFLCAMEAEAPWRRRARRRAAALRGAPS
jgi:hypothetical protein